MPSTTPRRGRTTGRASVPTSTSRAARGQASPSGSGRGPSTDVGGSIRASGSARVGGSGRSPLARDSGAYRRRRPRWGRIALVSVLGLLLLAGLGVVGGLVYAKRLDDGLKRTDPFSAITGSRPARGASGALNILLLGSDSRDPDAAAAAGKWRTDTMIFMHVPASHDKAYLISIPRDLYVYVPKSTPDQQYGDTKAKINSAFAWGGLPLVVQTIEGYSGVRIDHVVLIDFAGFKQVTDALGGVDMNIEQDITSIHPPYRHFQAGMNHLNGAEALDYVRQRYQFADGDFARMRHQQQFLKALMDKAASSGTLGNPAKLNAFLKSVTAAMTVDKDFSLTDLALQMRGIRGGDLTFLINPNKGSEMIDGESVVVSDKERAGALYEAVKQDTVSDWVAQNAPASTSKGSGSPG